MLHCACLTRAAPKPDARTRQAPAAPCEPAAKCAVLDDHRFAGARSMKSGIVEIEGVEYPDADASDPNAAGWMQGSPPPKAKQIRFEDDHFLEFPQIRWTLSHMRELAPTANVWRGNAEASDLGQAPHDLEAGIDALAFQDLHGRQLTWAQSLQHTYADGIIVLHRGRRIYER